MKFILTHKKFYIFSAFLLLTIKSNLFAQISEGFESSTPPPAGWTYNSVIHGTTNVKTGIRCATFNLLNDSIVSPIVATPGILTFYYRRSGTAPTSPQFVISRSSTVTGVRTQIGTITGAAFTTTYQLFTFDLSAFTNQHITITDKRGGGGNDLYVDDFSITSAGALINPTAQALPYLQDFGSAVGGFNTYPAGNGVLGFNGIDGTSISTQGQALSSTPTGNAVLTARSTAFATEPAGGLYGYVVGGNGRLGIATSNSTTDGLNQPVTAINTGSGGTKVTVSYDLEVLFSGDRTMGIELQYRAGTTGGWLSVSPTSVVNYPANPTINSITGYAQVVSGLTANTVYQFRWATWRNNTPGSTNTTIGLDNIAITADEPTITEVIVPQFIQGINGTNNERVPYSYRVTLSKLIANRTYRYYNQAVLSTDGATVNGAGNSIFVPTTGNFVQTSTPSLATVGNFGTFTASPTGTYTGWFVLEPTGNAKFTPGNNVLMRIMLNNSNSSSQTENYRLTTTSSAKVLTFAVSAGANNGSGIRGVSSAVAKNFVFLYDNQLGTGRPLSGTYIESDGVANTVANNYAGFYGTNVETVTGAWGAIIPNTLATGVRRIENRNLADGNVAGCARDADGVWPTGSINTVNPIVGNAALAIAPADAPLTACIPNSTASDVIPIALSEANTISSINNINIATSTDGTQVWSFSIRDGGATVDADALPTIVKRLTITKGTGNQVGNWLDAIQSVALFEGVTLVATGTPFADSIVFAGNPLVSVNDGASRTFVLRLTIKANFTASGINFAGDDFVFQVLNAKLFTDPNGSTASLFTNGFSTNGKNIIEVIGTKLTFTQQPLNTGQGSAMSPAVRVTVSDINNNTARLFTSQISITSTGTLTGTTVNVNAVLGVATFSGLIHTVVATGRQLTAASAGFTNITSNLFDIVPITQFQPGDLTIVAFNTDLNSGDDEITILCFRDILIGTKIDFTDNAFEKCTPGSLGWGISEGWFRLERRDSTLLAGNMITIRVTAAGVASVIAPDPSWNVSLPQPSGQGTGFNMNANGEQIFILQGGVVGGPTGNSATTDAGTYTGGSIISCFNTKGNVWTPACAASAGGGTQNSGKPLGIDCFLIFPTATADKNKFIGDGSATYFTVSRTKRQWLDAIGTPTFWVGYLDNATYNANTPAAPDFINFLGVGKGRKIVITPGGFNEGRWAGTKSNDWNACENWENLEVPFLTTQVDFQAGTPFSANLGGAGRGFAQNIAIANGATLTVNTSDSLVFSGSLTNNGTFTQTGAGFVVFRGAGTSNITGTATITTFSNLVIDKGINDLHQFDCNVSITGIPTLKKGIFNLSGTNTLKLANNFVTVAGSFAGNPLGSLEIAGNSGAFGSLSLNQSSASSRSLKNLIVSRTLFTPSAALGAPLELHGVLTITNSVVTFTTNSNLTLKSNDTTTASIASLPTPANFNGIIKAERYNSGISRRYRHMGSPITATNGNQLIDNIFVTGSGAGFDPSPRNNPTIFTYSEPLKDNLSTLAARQIGFVGLPTISTNIPVGSGFLVFTRGPRLTQPNPFSSASIPLPATIDFDGLINKGPIPVTLTKTANTNTVLNEQFEQIDGFNFLGNPYPSAINAELFVLSSPAMDKFIYSYNISSGVYDTYDINFPAASTPITAPKIVGLGQGFFVRANAASTVVNFTENMKVNAKVPLIYTRAAQTIPVAQSVYDIFRLKLVLDSVNSDETVLVFGGNDSSTYNTGRDALKFFGSGVSLAVYTSDNMYTAIKYLPTVLANDTISLFVNKVAASTLSVDNLAMLSFKPSLSIYLLDKYLNTTTDLRLKSSYNFSTTADSASFGTDRFKLIFASNSPLSADLLNFSGRENGNSNLLNWTTNLATINQGYFEVEKSENGKDFEKFDLLDFKTSNGIVKFKSVDANPFLTSYYRLKIVSDVKEPSFSKTIVVNRKNTVNTIFSIYPNPVSTVATIRLNEEIKTDANILLSDAAGKTIQRFRLKVGQKQISIDFSDLAVGNYTVTLTNNENTESIKFIKE